QHVLARELDDEPHALGLGGVDGFAIHVLGSPGRELDEEPHRSVPVRRDGRGVAGAAGYAGARPAASRKAGAGARRVMRVAGVPCRWRRVAVPPQAVAVIRDSGGAANGMIEDCACDPAPPPVGTVRDSSPRQPWLSPELLEPHGGVPDRSVVTHGRRTCGLAGGRPPPPALAPAAPLRRGNSWQMERAADPRRQRLRWKPAGAQRTLKARPSPSCGVAARRCRASWCGSARTFQRARIFANNSFSSFRSWRTRCATVPPDASHAPPSIVTHSPLMKGTASETRNAARLA